MLSTSLSLLPSCFWLLLDPSTPLCKTPRPTSFTSEAVLDSCRDIDDESSWRAVLAYHTGKVCWLIKLLAEDLEARKCVMLLCCYLDQLVSVRAAGWCFASACWCTEESDSKCVNVLMDIYMTAHLQCNLLELWMILLPFQLLFCNAYRDDRTDMSCFDTCFFLCTVLQVSLWASWCFTLVVLDL